jgi:hypothetical protein
MFDQTGEAGSIDIDPTVRTRIWVKKRQSALLFLTITNPS